MNKIIYKSLSFLGFPKYRVGDDGSVWRKYRWKNGERRDYWRRLKPKGHPYKQVLLCEGPDKRKQIQVHTLVLLAFVGPCPEGMEGRHFPDRSPSNNALSNLSYSTHKINMKDRDFHGTRNDKPSPGVKNWNHKFTDDMIPFIRNLHSEGKTSAEITIQLKIKWGVSVTPQAVKHVTTGRAWNHIPKNDPFQ